MTEPGTGKGKNGKVQQSHHNPNISRLLPPQMPQQPQAQQQNVPVPVKEVIVPADLVLAIRRYLGTRPYDEVGPFIEAMNKQMRGIPVNPEGTAKAAPPPA